MLIVACHYRVLIQNQIWYMVDANAPIILKVEIVKNARISLTIFHGDQLLENKHTLADVIFQFSFNISFLTYFYFKHAIAITMPRAVISILLFIKHLDMSVEVFAMVVATIQLVYIANNANLSSTRIQIGIYKIQKFANVLKINMLFHNANN